MTDRDNDQNLPKPNRFRTVIYILMMLIFSALTFITLSGDINDSEEQEKCDPDTDFTCRDPSGIIIRFIANFHFMLWHTSSLG